MRWTPGGVSDDIEDQRDGGGGGGFGYGPHLGIGGIIVVGILSLLFHRNFFALFYGGPGPDPSTAVSSGPRPAARDANDKQVQFVSFVLDDVQHTWETLLPQQGHRDYRHAKLVLFRDQVQSACGLAQSATGPFYCPGDEKVYLDLGFFDELRTRFGAPGEAAEAYVIAHEIGHHVQKLLGTEAQVTRLQQADPRERNPLSVDLELQADCYAGVWAHATEQRNVIDQRDVADALRAAAAVGDDRLQKMATGRVSPDSFTHGTSAQRMHWFQAGVDSGQISSCNTFGSGR